MPSAMSRAPETQPAQMVGQGRKSMPGMLLMTKGSATRPSGTIKSSHGTLWDSPPTSPRMGPVMKEPYIHKALLLKTRSEEHTSELQSRFELVCRLLLEKKK